MPEEYENQIEKLDTKIAELEEDLEVQTERAWEEGWTLASRCRGAAVDSVARALFHRASTHLLHGLSESDAVERATDELRDAMIKVIGGGE